MAKRSREKARREHARREAEAAKAVRDAMLYGTGFMRGGRHVELKDALRNVNRTATRGLDEAGVPDRLQGAGQEEWEDFE